jgi:hypothetical protein
LLKNQLPELLVEHKKIYAKLSKRIHEFSEDECLKYFGPMRTGIKLILDEKVDKLNRKNKIKMRA